MAQSISLDPQQRGVVAGGSSGYLGVMRLQSGTTVEVPHEGDVDALALGPPKPNPTRRSVAMTLALRARTPVRAEVLDAAGRLVRPLLNATFDAGPCTVEWDGRGSDGRRVSAGVYFIRTTAGMRTRSQRVVVLK